MAQLDANTHTAHHPETGLGCTPIAVTQENIFALNENMMNI
jgi:hypothetical protein